MMKIEKIFNSILKQKRTVSRVPGAILQMYSGSQQYLNIIMSFTILATGYATAYSPTLHKYFPWMNFAIFISAFIVYQLIAMLIHWKYVQPSQQAFNAKQGYDMPNPAVDDLKDIIARLKRIEEIINEK